MNNDINEDTLFDLHGREKTVVTLKKGTKEYSLTAFLDGISEIMETKKKEISDKYLALAVLSVGHESVDVGNFIYGLLIGKYITEKKYDIKIHVSPLSDEDMEKYKNRISEDFPSPFNNYFKGKQKDTTDGEQ